LTPLFGSTIDDQFRAFLGETHGNALAEALGRSSDERHLAAELIHDDFSSG
jgi:hypothetical protein